MFLGRTAFKGAHKGALKVLFSGLLLKGSHEGLLFVRIPFSFKGSKGALKGSPKGVCRSQCLRKGRGSYYFLGLRVRELFLGLAGM